MEGVGLTLVLWKVLTHFYFSEDRNFLIVESVMHVQTLEVCLNYYISNTGNAWNQHAVLVK